MFGRVRINGEWKSPDMRNALFQPEQPMNPVIKNFC